MKKKCKYNKAPKEPNKSHIIRIRVTEDEYNDILVKAMQSPLKNVSAYCRKKLQGKYIGVALTDEERQLIAGVAAARIDIVRFTSAVEAATKNMNDEQRKKYILSLGVQRIWSSAVNRVYNFIYDFLKQHNYDGKW